MNHQSPQLDYEPANSRRVPRTLRRLLWLGLIAIIGAALWWQAPGAYQNMMRAYWQSRVQSYVAPPDLIVYEEDPERWPTLLAQPGYQMFTMPPTSPGASSYVGYPVQPIQRLREYSDLAIAGSNAIFAHSRQTPDGREYLVIVWMALNGVRGNEQGATPDNQVRLHLSTTVIAGREVKRGFLSPWIAPDSVARDRQTPLYARIYAGQVNPDDPTHFTIPFEIGDYVDVLDGYLRDDGKIILRPRKLDHPLNP